MTLVSAATFPWESGGYLNCLVKEQRKDKGSPADIITRGREALLGRVQYQIRIQSKNF